MLSKANQKELIELYKKYQEEYNRTHEQNILWNNMRPLLLDMIANCAKKLSKGHYIPDFQHRVEAQTDRVVKRYLDNPSYNRDLPLTLAHYEAVNMLYADSYDKLIGNYDHDLEYSNASYEDGEDDTKIVDVGGNRIVMDYNTKEFALLKEGEKVEEVVKALEENGWNLTNK